MDHTSALRKKQQTKVKTEPRTEMHTNNQATAGWTFFCCQCRKSCFGIPYSFAVNLACESCVRAYYRDSGEIAEELRCRAFDALRLIARTDKRRRKSKTLSD